MKVGELVDQLQALDPDLPVATDPRGCGCCDWGELRTTETLGTTRVHGEYELVDHCVFVVQVRNRTNDSAPFDVAVL